MKIIILYTANYCDKIRSYFGVDSLIENNVKVEFWNLSKITVNESLFEVKSNGLIIREVRSIKEYYNLVKDNRNEIFISFINYARFSIIVYFVLSLFNCRIWYTTSGVLPIVKLSKLKVFKISNIYMYLKNYLTRYIKYTPLFKPAEKVFLSCKKATCDYKTSQQTSYVYVNSNDYESFYVTQKFDEDNIICFIDQYLPYHKDFQINKINYIDDSRYFNEINSFFYNIERKFNCNVVICAHPSAIKYKTLNPYNNRCIVFNRTQEIIKKSKLVILHDSTAISYAILAQKPIISILTDDIIRNYLLTQKRTELLSNLVGSTLLNISKEYELLDTYNVNIEKYNQYIKDYLSYNNDNVRNWKIIIKNLEK